MEPAAERTFRRATAQNTSDYAALTTWLATHGKLAEAVQLCLDEGANDETPRSATVLTRALVLGHADRETAQRVDPFLQAALRKHADHAEFLFSLATWRLVEERNEDAVMLLRKVLLAEPRQPDGTEQSSYGAG